MRRYWIGVAVLHRSEPAEGSKRPGFQSIAIEPHSLRFRRKDNILRRHWHRFVGRVVGQAALVGWLGLAGLVLSVQAQEPAAMEYSPASLIPAENLLLYAEFDGLDAHAEAWHKTAAYRLLTETSTGAMLEDLIVQALSTSLKGPATPAELLKVVKHLAHAGFTMGTAMSGEEALNTDTTIFVFHKAFSNKEIRPIFARLLQALSKEGTKPMAMTQDGLKMITGEGKGGHYHWWIEATKKEDLILVFDPPQQFHKVAGVLTGKNPSALTHPIRKELAQKKTGFERTGFAFLDAKVGISLRPNLNTVQFFKSIKMDRVDFQGGFQDDALMTMSQFHSTAVPQGNGASPNSFEKATIPGVPPGVLGLMVMAFDLKTIADQIRNDPTTGPKYQEWVAWVKEKTKIDFEEGVVKQLGPKITTYIAPSKTTSSTASALPNALSLLSSMGVGGGGDAIPKLAILIDVANAAKFGQTVDELMIQVNKQLKTSYAPPAGPAGEPGARGRGPTPPSPEFRVMSGETKSYVFNVPSQLSSSFPAGFRPTIRIGPKQVALGVSADVARQALETKGSYTPPPEIADAFTKLPARLTWLLVTDPRDSTSEILAGLPGKLQAGINMMTTPATAPTPNSSTTPGGPGKVGAVSSMDSMNMMPGGGQPAAPGAAPAAGTTGAPGSPGHLVLQVDPSKLPSADAIRKLLFPAIYTLEEDGNIIRFTSRTAFPPIPDPSLIGLIGRGYKMRQIPGGPGLPGMNPASGVNPTVPGASSLRPEGPGSRQNR